MLQTGMRSVYILFLKVLILIEKDRWGGKIRNFFQKVLDMQMFSQKIWNGLAVHLAFFQVLRLIVVMNTWPSSQHYEVRI